MSEFILRWQQLPNQRSTKTCNCMDIVTMTPVKRSCQSVKVPFTRSCPFISTSVLLQTRCSSSSLFLLIQRLLVAGSRLPTKLRIKAWTVREAGSPVSRSQRLKVSLLWSGIASWCRNLPHAIKRDRSVAPNANLSDTRQAHLDAFAFFRSLFTPSSFNYTSAQPLLHAINLNQSISRLNKPCSDIRSLSILPLC